MSKEKEFDPTDEQRPLFDWVIFVLIHLVLIGGIGYAGVATYGWKLGGWVLASATVAGLTSAYLFAKVVPGETLMKCLLGLAVAANAGYLVHNGAQAMGIELYNAAQVKKYEIAMGQAAQATSRRIAREIGVSARTATELEKAFGDGVSLIAALLAFLELSLAVMFFSIASKRVNAIVRREREEAEHTDSGKRPQYFAPPASAPAPATAKNSNFTFPDSPKSAPRP